MKHLLLSVSLLFGLAGCWNEEEAQPTPRPSQQTSATTDAGTSAKSVVIDSGHSITNALDAGETSAPFDGGDLTNTPADAGNILPIPTDAGEQKRCAG